jgi:hypothetical protein
MGVWAAGGKKGPADQRGLRAKVGQRHPRMGAPRHSPAHGTLGPVGARSGGEGRRSDARPRPELGPGGRPDRDFRRGPGRPEQPTCPHGVVQSEPFAGADTTISPGRNGCGWNGGWRTCFWPANATGFGPPPILCIAPSARHANDSSEGSPVAGADTVAKGSSLNGPSEDRRSAAVFSP